MGEQLLQNLGSGAVDRGGRDTVKIGAAPPVVSAPPGDHVGHDFVGDVSQSLALQVRTGHQSVEVGESLSCADLVLSHLVEIAHTRRVYEQIRGVRQTALQQRPPPLSYHRRMIDSSIAATRQLHTEASPLARWCRWRDFLRHPGVCVDLTSHCSATHT